MHMSYQPVHTPRHGADRTLLDNQGMSALDHAQQVESLKTKKAFA